MHASDPHVTLVADQLPSFTWALQTKDTEPGSLMGRGERAQKVWSLSVHCEVTPGMCVLSLVVGGGEMKGSLSERSNMDPTGPTGREQVLFIFVAPVPGAKSVFHTGSETEHIPPGPGRITPGSAPRWGGGVCVYCLPGSLPGHPNPNPNFSCPLLLLNLCACPILLPSPNSHQNSDIRIPCPLGTQGHS